jgi:hypothetical protein
VDDAVGQGVTVLVPVAEGEPEPDRVAHSLGLDVALGWDAVAQPLAVNDADANADSVAMVAEGGGEKDAEGLPEEVRDTEMLRVEEERVVRVEDTEADALEEKEGDWEREPSGVPLPEKLPMRESKGVKELDAVANALPENVCEGDAEVDPVSVLEAETRALRLPEPLPLGETDPRGEPELVAELVSLTVGGPVRVGVSVGYEGNGVAEGDPLEEREPLGVPVDEMEKDGDAQNVGEELTVTVALTLLVPPTASFGVPVAREGLAVPEVRCVIE